MVKSPYNYVIYPLIQPQVANQQQKILLVVALSQNLNSGHLYLKICIVDTHKLILTELYRVVKLSM